MSDLKPCPFCGGEARIIAKPYEPKVCVGCDDDTCLGFSGLGWLYDSEKEATEAWNRRAERTSHRIADVEFLPKPTIDCDELLRLAQEINDTSCDNRDELSVSLGDIWGWSQAIREALGVD